MYSHGLFLSLAVRASPQTHDGTRPSVPLTPSHAVPGFRPLQIHLAVQGGPPAMHGSPNAVVPHAPVVPPVPLAKTAIPVTQENGAPVLPCATITEPPAMTEIALSPPVKSYLDGELEDRVSETVARLCDQTLDDLLDDKIDEKVREVLSEQVDELASLEARVDNLEGREAFHVDEDDVADLRLDVLTLTGQIDQLTPLGDAVVALIATCEALSARVAHLEQARSGCQRDGEVSAGGAA